MDDFNLIIDEMNPKLLIALSESKLLGSPSSALLELMEDMLKYYSDYKHIVVSEKTHAEYVSLFSKSWMLFNAKTSNDPFMFFYFIVKNACLCCCMKEKLAA